MGIFFLILKKTYPKTNVDKNQSYNTIKQIINFISIYAKALLL